MSIRIMTRVWEYSQHKGSTLLLLLAIADFTDDRGENAWPSVDTLSRKIRMTERQTRYLLRTLEKSGELVVARRGGGRKRSNLFRVSIVDTGQSHVKRGQSSVETGQPTAPDTSLVPTNGTSADFSKTETTCSGWSPAYDPAHGLRCVRCGRSGKAHA